MLITGSDDDFVYTFDANSEVRLADKTSCQESDDKKKTN